MVRAVLGPVAIDGSWPYYSTKRGLHRFRLPARAMTTPPPNDDFDDATFLGARLPLRAAGRIGHATAERHDPPVEGVRYARTVWYSFRARRTGDLYRRGWPGHVFTRSHAGDLRPVAERYTGREMRLSVRAGKKYWILVGSGPEPDYRTFSIDIRREPSSG